MVQALPFRPPLLARLVGFVSMKAFRCHGRFCRGCCLCYKITKSREVLQLMSVSQKFVRRRRKEKGLFEIIMR